MISMGIEIVALFLYTGIYIQEYNLNKQYYMF